MCAVVLVGQQQERTDRVDWMGFTEIDTQKGANVYQNMSKTCQLSNTWGGENPLTTNEYK